MMSMAHLTGESEAQPYGGIHLASIAAGYQPACGTTPYPGRRIVSTFTVTDVTCHRCLRVGGPL